MFFMAQKILVFDTKEFGIDCDMSFDAKGRLEIAELEFNYKSDKNLWIVSVS